jgi:heme exporter protein D
VIWPEFFAYGGKQVRTVWSYFGIAYGFVPLVLPILGLIWLGKSKQK